MGLERSKTPESETMDLDVFDFTLKRDKPKLGVSLVGYGKRDPREDLGIFIGSIDESGDVSKDGRISKISKSNNLIDDRIQIKIMNMYFRAWRLSTRSQ